MKLTEAYAECFEGNILKKPIIIDTTDVYTIDKNIEIEFDPPYPSLEEIQKLPSLRYGFFAGILLIGENITVDLNGHEIKMSDKYALQQRFFSIFELTNSPFPLHDGLPLAMKKETWKTGKNITIRNGNIGRSSHSGIHGNETTSLNIYSLNIYDFEVGGIMTNGANDVNIHCCHIGPNFQNLWVNAKLSAAQQLLHFHKNVIPQADDRNENIQELQKIVDLAVDATSLTKVPELFRNDKLVCDGTVYGLSFHKRGVAIGGHSDPTSTTVSELANTYCIKNITIHHLKGNVDEKTSYVTKEGRVLRDIAGQIIDIDSFLEKQEFDILMKVQLDSSEWIKKYPHVKTTFFVPDEILEIYYENGEDFPSMKDVIERLLDPKMGRDIMIHVNKGVMALRLDSLNRVVLEGIVIQDIENIAAHTVENKDSLIPAMMEDSLKEYKGNDTLAVSCSNINNGKFKNISIQNIFSKFGTAYGILLMNQCENIDSSFNKIMIGENQKNCGILVQDSCKNITVSLQ